MVEVPREVEAEARVVEELQAELDYKVELTEPTTKEEVRRRTLDSMWDAEIAYLIENGWLSDCEAMMDEEEVPHVEGSTLLETAEPDSEATVGGDNKQGGQIVEVPPKEVEDKRGGLHIGTDIPQEPGNVGE